jgi:CDP-diacylglycerol--serine O-phosphatidyltransferase
MGNMFCGYACIVYAMRGDFERPRPSSASPSSSTSGWADCPPDRHASDFGVELDSLADVISFGVAPAILSFAWGLQPLGRLGYAAGFLYVSAAALRLARFNIQSAAVTDKRYFVGMPSPPAAGIAASTVYVYPYGLHDYRAALPALAMVLIPAVLMVSTIRFRSFKTIDLKMRRPYTVLFLIALGIMAIATHPKIALIVIAYSYLASAFVGMAIRAFAIIASRRFRRC